MDPQIALAQNSTTMAVTLATRTPLSSSSSSSWSWSWSLSSWSSPSWRDVQRLDGSSICRKHLRKLFTCVWFMLLLFSVCFVSILLCFVWFSTDLPNQLKDCGLRLSSLTTCGRKQAALLAKTVIPAPAACVAFGISIDWVVGWAHLVGLGFCTCMPLFTFSVTFLSLRLI